MVPEEHVSREGLKLRWVALTITQEHLSKRGRAEC